MALADGDYLAMAGKAVETLLADTGPGGLREQPNAPSKPSSPGFGRKPNSIPNTSCP